jgi:hypothetical protein
MSEIIFLLAMIGSVVTLVGSMVFLFKQKTIVNQNGEVTEVEVPFFGKVKSNYPSIVTGFLGAALAAFTIERVVPEVPRIGLSATVGLAQASNVSDLPVFVGVVPQEYFTSTMLDAEGRGLLEFSVEDNKAYNVVVLKPHTVTPNGVRFLSTHGPATLSENKLLFDGVLR